MVNPGSLLKTGLRCSHFKALVFNQTLLYKTLDNTTGKSFAHNVLNVFCDHGGSIIVQQK